MHHELFLTSLILCKLISSIILYQQYQKLSQNQLRLIISINFSLLLLVCYAAYLLRNRISPNDKMLLIAMGTVDIPASVIFYSLFYAYNGQSDKMSVIMNSNLSVIIIDAIAIICSFKFLYDKYKLNKNSLISLGEDQGMNMYGSNYGNYLIENQNI